MKYLRLCAMKIILKCLNVSKPRAHTEREA